MGMAHRGRLNVLCSVMGKSFAQLFEQFSENYIPDTVAGDGDVKYHLGYESNLSTTSGQKVEECASRPILRTWRSSIRWSRARPAPASGSGVTPTRGEKSCRF